MSAFVSPAASDRCPCTSGDAFGACCAPIITSGVAPTAVRLMRSRFTAFAVGDAGHLLRTWHPATRPDRLDLDAATRWLRLDILAHEAGGPFASHGVVEFAAFYRDVDGPGALRERSRFERESRVWLYVDGDVLPSNR
ncbi:YchJ family protein [Microbacterium sp. NPDC058345]|uniref:YchJ family protein n=1 Tax=Microbacterium sp. NPDC058345 TaxID=3346455 RepID=UPI003653F392